MHNIVDSEEFNPKKIYDDLIDRAKQAKAWHVYCELEDEWILKVKSLPFDMRIKDDICSCVVICPSYKEAQTIVANTLPVVRFFEEPK